MSAIGFVLEKVRHGSELSSGELKLLGEEIDRLVSKLEGCAQEVARREDAYKISRQQDRDRADRLRRAEEEVERLRTSSAHAKQQHTIEFQSYDRRLKEKDGILRDIHYGLLYQPEITREQLATTIASEVTPHPKRKLY
jgi:hypothetical protein